MSRMRQVPVMDITQREKALRRNLPVSNTHPIQQSCYTRQKKSPAARLHLADAPALLSSGCHSVKELCNHVQHITADLNQLMNSVEHMLPLLTAYVTALQTRSSMPESLPASAPKEPELYRLAPEIPAEAETPVQSQQMPSPEDLQQLFTNPLVQNLMQSFMQNNVK